VALSAKPIAVAISKQVSTAQYFGRTKDRCGHGEELTYKKQLSAVDLGQGVDEERIGGNAWRT
jgi:hypothetical protein